MALDDLAKADRSGRPRNRGRRGSGSTDRSESRRGGRGGRGRGGRSLGGGRGGAERRRGSFRGRRNPYSRDGEADEADHWGHDLYEKQLRQPSPPRSAEGDYGTQVNITNLHYEVLEDELVELFGTFGKVVKATIVYDDAGRSTGEATVLFQSESQAEKAAQEYNNRAIDGETMTVEVGKTVLLKAKKPERKPRHEDAEEEEEDDDDRRPRGRGFRGKRGGRGGMRSARGEEDDDELRKIKISVRV